MNIEEMQKEENFEHEVLDRLKCLDPTDFDYNAVDGSYVDAVLKARDILLTAYEKEKEKNKELEKENKKLNLIRLQFLVSSFPDTTETYKKYRKELDELLKEE